MSVHGSSRDRGRIWLVLLVAISAALISLVAFMQRDSFARADEHRGHKITLERSTAPAIRHELSGATDQGGVEPRIVGGTPVPNGKYPFMTIMSIEFANGTSGLCGGSLIDPNSVLTAAHCLVNAQAVRLAVGRTVISQTQQGQFRVPTTAFIHPQYNGGRNFRYDAAVIKLPRAVRGIKPIKLATAKQNRLESPGHRLKIAGWGSTREGGNVTDRMREVSVPVVSDRTAKRAYSSAYSPSLMVAAGVRGKDACQGDSGGPLFQPGITRTQVGIVSFGRGCARPRFPGVTAEVNNSSIRTFIVNAARR
jgi:secreted trypsin-like serine protease